MTKHRTLIDYGRRVERVVEHIARHPDGALDLARLADIASFSPFHFHRIYRELSGETLADTLRRHRLHRAAGELIGTDLPLERLARRAGYASLAAFSRAFSADYGVPPGTYRLRGRLDPPRPHPQTGELVMYDVTIGPFAGVRLAARDHRGDYQKIGGTFDALNAYAAPRGLIKPRTRFFAIYFDDPADVTEADLRSTAGLEIDESFAPDGDVTIAEIAPARCASVLHKGPYAELEQAYAFLYREWLPKSGEEPADRPCFEEYLNDPRTLPPAEWLTRVYLPLA